MNNILIQTFKKMRFIDNMNCSRILLVNNTLRCKPQNEDIPFELIYSLGFLIAPLVTCLTVFIFLLAILVISKTLHSVWTLLLRLIYTIFTKCTLAYGAINWIVNKTKAN